MSYEIAFITVAREPVYLYDTLDSFARASEPPGAVPRLFVGSPDEEYLANPELWYRVFPYEPTIVSMPRDLWQRIKALPTHQRAAANFARALLHNHERDLVLFEDDIELKPGWAAHLAKTLEHLGEPRPFLSLYSAVKHPDYGCLDRPIDKPVEHYGTLGLFVPSEHRQPLGAIVMEQLGELGQPFDMLVCAYVNQTPTARYHVTLPSFVDHRGDVSKIETNRTHGPRRSPNY